MKSLNITSVILILFALLFMAMGNPVMAVVIDLCAGSLMFAQGLFHGAQMRLEYRRNGHEQARVKGFYYLRGEEASVRLYGCRDNRLKKVELPRTIFNL